MPGCHSLHLWYWWAMRRAFHPGHIGFAAPHRTFSDPESISALWAVSVLAVTNVQDYGVSNVFRGTLLWAANFRVLKLLHPGCPSLLTRHSFIVDVPHATRRRVPHAPRPPLDRLRSTTLRQPAPRAQYCIGANMLAHAFVVHISHSSNLLLIDGCGRPVQL